MNSNTSSIWSSNVRSGDKSCHNKPKNDEMMHQCKTCDKELRYYLCKKCLESGGHESKGHKVVSKQFNKTKDIICNCGEFNGFLKCEAHSTVSKDSENEPVYSKDEVKDFSENFDIKTPIAIDLIRINQICDLNMDSTIAKMIVKYLKNSNSHGWKLKIVRIWSVMRKDNEKSFAKDFEKEARMLLWHGTSWENLQNILQKGFKQPAEDGMFGLGLYFADRSSKSVQYTEKTGTLLLCEVAVGKMMNVIKPRNYKKGYKGFGSLKGVGKRVPDYDCSYYFNGDIVVPAGRTIDNPNPKDTTLVHNEYVIFDPKRILIKYIVEIKGNQKLLTD